MQPSNEISPQDFEIPTKIKSRELIDDKRRQIIKGALSVFKKKGYHKTTVRDIARAADISMGSLYDYISSKEDILYIFYQLFIITYYQKVVSVTNNISNPAERLKVAFKTLLEVGFSLEDEILFGWTEAKNMKKNHLKEILKLELELINYFKEILDKINAQFHAGIEDTFMVANFLVYSSTFGILRRWVFKSKYSKEQIVNYIMNTQLNNLIPQLNFPS